ncbi:MAG: ComEA family DNA-binding protein [Xanthomonadales bacterium]|nr:ComEA family DNA-binding protein [Xanthomonadales bacterium]NNL94141.1 ComEA family DNA-binding protein [Xanthomonadales bacterium]
MKVFFTFVLSALFSVMAWAASVVNVNTASAEELAQALKGVGLKKAEAIVAYRESNGQFQHIDELVNVKGIGVRTIDLNRGVIMLDGETQLASEDSD